MAEVVDTFNEKSTGFITLDFKDEDDAAVVPDSATYTLYDEVTGTATSGTGIINNRNATPISGLTSSFDLELEPADNVIVDSDSDMEAHILLVEWIYNSDKRGNDDFRFFVRNLTKVT